MQLLVNEAAEQHNIKVYRERGTSRSDEPRHICVLCDKQCSIDGSMSNRGSHLICNVCARIKFDSILDAYNWIGY